MLYRLPLYSNIDPHGSASNTDNPMFPCQGHDPVVSCIGKDGELSHAPPEMYQPYELEKSIVVRNAI